jgi:hypothetical protein
MAQKENLIAMAMRATDSLADIIYHEIPQKQYLLLNQKNKMAEGMSKAGLNINLQHLFSQSIRKTLP